jgi:hypothetical protein
VDALNAIATNAMPDEDQINAFVTSLATVLTKLAAAVNLSAGISNARSAVEANLAGGTSTSGDAILAMVADANSGLGSIPITGTGPTSAEFYVPTKPVWNYTGPSFSAIPPTSTGGGGGGGGGGGSSGTGTKTLDDLIAVLQGLVDALTSSGSDLSAKQAFIAWLSPYVQESIRLNAARV